MSPLSVTLFAFLHCHPGVMSSVSLLPVAYVVVSAVDPAVKSLKNAAETKPVGSEDCGVPVESNKFDQSGGAAARRNVDVAVAGEEAELLEARPRVVADALRVLAVDHQLDEDVLLLRIARQLDVAHDADGHTGDLHRIALREPGHAVEA